MSRKLEEIRDMLCEELDKIADKGELSAGSLDLVDKLTHSIKSIDAIMATEERGSYSERGYSYNWRDGDMRGNSYAREREPRRDARGRYSRGGGYSYAGGMDELLREMRDMLPGLPEEKRRRAERLLSEMER